MTDIRTVTFSAMLIAIFLTAGCGWVDSTGRQAGDPLAEHISRGVPLTVSQTAPLALTENTPRVVRLQGSDGLLEDWSWRTLDEPGDPYACAGVEDFDPEVAQRSLRAACTDQASCALIVDESHDGIGTRFTLRLPALRAPVAARVALTTTDEAGERVERRQTVCGVSTNEAPEAKDDRYTVRTGTTLRVGARDRDSLLANDSDDDDVRNRPLAIDPLPARAPRHAASFELGRDGSFSYQPLDDVLTGPDDTLEDSFAYTLSDGLFEVVAEVVIVIDADGATFRNTAPVALEPLPDAEFALDGRFGANVLIDLSRRFVDPDDDTLTFSVRPGSLPASGALSLSRDGVLRGRLDSDDLGRWLVSVIVDDGRETLEIDFTLRVVRAFEANVVPDVTDIANRTFSDSFRYDVAPFFDDPDGDTLQFSAKGLPDDVVIDKAGVIDGRSRRGNRGSWFVVVTANDGRGGEVSDGFRLTIE